MRLLKLLFKFNVVRELADCALELHYSYYTEKERELLINWGALLANPTEC